MAYTLHLALQFAWQIEAMGLPQIIELTLNELLASLHALLRQSFLGGDLDARSLRLWHVIVSVRLLLQSFPVELLLGLLQLLLL